MFIDARAILTKTGIKPDVGIVGASAAGIRLRARLQPLDVSRQAPDCNLPCQHARRPS